MAEAARVLAPGEPGLQKTTIAVLSAFDREAADALSSRVRKSILDGPVVVDFSHSPVIHDNALPMLADILRQASVDVLKVVGLGTHQQRILRYLGIEPERMA